MAQSGRFEPTEIDKGIIEVTRQAIGRARAALIISLIASAIVFGTAWNYEMSWLAGVVHADIDDTTLVAQRKFAEMYVESSYVEILPLGVRMQASDAAFLGSATLVVAALWTYATLRRENHAVHDAFRRCVTPGDPSAQSSTTGDGTMVEYYFRLVAPHMVLSMLTVGDEVRTDPREPPAQSGSSGAVGKVFRRVLNLAHIAPATVILFVVLADLHSLLAPTHYFPERHDGGWVTIESREPGPVGEWFLAYVLPGVEKLREYESCTPPWADRCREPDNKEVECASWEAYCDASPPMTAFPTYIRVAERLTRSSWNQLAFYELFALLAACIAYYAGVASWRFSEGTTAILKAARSQLASNGLTCAEDERVGCSVQTRVSSAMYGFELAVVAVVCLGLGTASGAACWHTVVTPAASEWAVYLVLWVGIVVPFSRSLFLEIEAMPDGQSRWWWEAVWLGGWSALLGAWVGSGGDDPRIFLLFVVGGDALGIAMGWGSDTQTRPADPIGGRAPPTPPSPPPPRTAAPS